MPRLLFVSRPVRRYPLNESGLTGPLPSGGCDDVEDCVKAVDAFEEALLLYKIEPPALTVAAILGRLLPAVVGRRARARVIDAVGRVYGDPRVCRDVGGRLALDPGEVSEAFRRGDAGSEVASKGRVT